jgi:hypothetical protein
MIDLLRDGIWQFIGAVLALLGVIAAMYIYWQQRQLKELAFGLVSSRRPLAIADELSSRVTVQLDGRSVVNLHLLVFGLRNSGHQAIDQGHFQGPLTIIFSSGQVVSAEITSQVPSNLRAELVVSHDHVELKPLLLNAGDQVLVQVLLSSPTPTWEVDARIVDVPSLVPINHTPRLPPFFQSGLLLLLVLSLLAGFGALFLEGWTDRAYAFFGFAGFTLIFGFSSRVLNDSGRAARRRISES